MSVLQIELSQRDETGSIGRTLSLVRQIRYRSNSRPVFHSKAILSGDAAWIEDDDKVQKLRDSFLPRHLARFFFFDAERGQSIQLNEREIIEGVVRILGLYSYTELEEDLRNLTTQIIPQRFGRGTESERSLNEVSSGIIREESNLKTLASEDEEKKQELRDIDEELTEIEDQLRTLGAVDPVELQKAQEQRIEVKSVKDRLEANLQSSWEMALPLALLGLYRNELSDYLKKEELRRDWENRKSSVEPKIPQVKDEVFNHVMDDFKLNEGQRSFYELRLENALQGLFNPPDEGMSESVYVVPERNEISVQVRMKLASNTQTIKGLSELCGELERKSSELRELDQKLKQLQSDPEAMKRGNELRERRGSILQQKDQIETRQSDILAERTQIERRLQEMRKEETKLGEQVQKIQKGRDLNSLAHRYRDAVSEIKLRAAIQLREKISDIVGGLWLDITDRGMEYVAMEFDQHWNCILRKSNKTTIAWESANTAAGQRQVRILAFTEALRRLARLIPPLVIDTPLARLDKEVKKNVLDRLYLSGHQSIMLTTNSEIEPNSQLFEFVAPKLARVYTLNPVGDQESNSYHVRVSDDYFKRVL